MYPPKHLLELDDEVEIDREITGIRGVTQNALDELAQINTWSEFVDICRLQKARREWVPRSYRWLKEGIET